MKPMSLGRDYGIIFIKIIGVCAAITYWFGYGFIENLTNMQ